MSNNIFRRPRAVIAIGALLVLAGCLGAVGSDDPAVADDADDDLETDGDLEVDDIVDNVDQRYDEIEDVQGTMTIEYETDGEVERTVMAFWERPPDEYRTEILEATGPESAGDVTVTDGERMWIYDSAANEVSVLEFDSDLAAEPMADETDEFRAQLEPYNVTDAGTESVDGRETHVLELTPSASGEAIAGYEQQTMWIDAEYWYPIKEEMVLTENGERVTITTTYDDLAFNEGIDDERFTFDPPADAEIVETDLPDVQEYDSVEEASQAVPFDVHEPAVPDAYDRTTVTVSDSEQETAVSAIYEHADEDAQLVFSATADEPRADRDGETVTIDGVEGTVVDRFGLTSVYWECDGVYYELSETGDLEADALVDVAAAVPCE